MMRPDVRAAYGSNLLKDEPYSAGDGGTPRHAIRSQANWFSLSRQRKEYKRGDELPLFD
jgi:hypothetical protein